MKGVEEDFPFDDRTLVYKVGGKMFVLTDIDEFSSINIKCDPEMVMQRIDQYQAVGPGFHMNKKYWITVLIDGSIPDKLILEWIKDSYKIVFEKLPDKIKTAVENSN